MEQLGAICIAGLTGVGLSMLGLLLIESGHGPLGFVVAIGGWLGSLWLGTVLTGPLPGEGDTFGGE